MRIFQKGFNFSQDGPGNRLVYHLQGCNRRCPWGSNPEGLTLSGGTECPVEALLEEVSRSALRFFGGGGVTLTGGEVTLQLDEVRQLLHGLHGQGVNTCIETNGISPRLPELFPELDLLIMDIKHHDPETHRRVTGLPNTGTFRSIQAALAQGQRLALRIPLIGGFNASMEDARAFARLLTQLGVPGHASVELLAYHEYGKSKYEKLGMAYTMGADAHVSRETAAEFGAILSAAGIELIHT